MPVEDGVVTKGDSERRLMAFVSVSQPAPKQAPVFFHIHGVFWHLWLHSSLPACELQELNQASSGSSFLSFHKENCSCALESSVPIKVSGFETNKYG